MFSIKAKPKLAHLVRLQAYLRRRNPAGRDWLSVISSGLVIFLKLDCGRNTWFLFENDWMCRVDRIFVNKRIVNGVRDKSQVSIWKNKAQINAGNLIDRIQATVNEMKDELTVAWILLRHVCVICFRFLTNDWFCCQVAQLAGALVSYGVQRGDRVLIYMPMIPEAVVAMLATVRIGAVHSLVFGGKKSISCPNLRIPSSLDS